VQYNDNGIVSGATNFTYNKATSAVAINGPVNLSLAGTSTVTLGESASYGVLVGSGVNAASIYINGATRPGFNAVLQFGAAEHQFYNSSLSALIATLNTTAFGIGVAPVAGRGAIQLSAGVGFPATQVASSDANCLDDYEEGSWTIGLTFGGGTTGLTTSSNAGRYTKVGRQVTLSGYIALSNKGSSVGAAVINGLPFTIGAPNAAYSAASLRLASISYTGAFQAFGAVNGITIGLEQISALGAVLSLTDVNFANNSEIIFSLTYTV
jgi:hypothetical protein